MKINKINKKKQQGATLIAWLLGLGLAILVVSAVVKVAPYYVEFNTVKGMMKSIASDPGIKSADTRQVNSKVENFLNINQLRGLEESYYASRDKSSGVKNPFKVSKLKKGKNRRKLTVTYPVKVSWIKNLSFWMDFEHTVVLGEPENTTGE